MQNLTSDEKEYRLLLEEQLQFFTDELEEIKAHIPTIDKPTYEIMMEIYHQTYSDMCRLKEKLQFMEMD